MKPAGLNASDFLDQWGPYRKKYGRVFSERIAEDGRILDPGGWREVKRRLKHAYVRQAVDGQAELAYYLPTFTRALSADLDDHESPKAWTDRGASVRLLTRYERTVAVLGYPSGLWSSPRGLHAVWLLTQAMPLAVLHELARRKLGEMPGVELLPTMDAALRIPQRERQLHPVTLEAHRVGVAEMPLHDPYLLFNTDPQAVRETLLESRLTVKDRRARLRMVKDSGKIAQLEKQAIEGALRNKNSNTMRLQLVAVYRSAGYTEDETVRALLNVFTACRYTGPASNPKTLAQWVSWEYRKNRTADFQPAAAQPDLFNSAAIEALVARHPFAKQRTQAVRRFLYRLANWKDWQDSILKNRREASVWNYLYPYWLHNVSRGFYPLPFSVLSKWHDRYNELLPWLEAEGVLEKAPFGYSTGHMKAGKWVQSCKHYRIVFSMKRRRKRSADTYLTRGSPS